LPFELGEQRPRTLRTATATREWRQNVGHACARGKARILQERVVMTAWFGKFSTALAMLLAVVAVPRAARVSPLDALTPDVVLTPPDRARLAQGETIVQLNVSPDGYLSLTAMVRADVTADRMLRWSSSVETLQKGQYVSEIGRFTMPPRIEDLHALSLEDKDLADLPSCLPSKCGVKLSATEIASFRGMRRSEAVTAQWRRVLTERAARYLERGDECAEPYVDHSDAVSPAVAFGAVLQRLEFFPRNLRPYADYLRHYPAIADQHIEQSFLYWSKETLGLKPITSITHFTAARFDEPHLPEAVVVAKQVYASHYKTASLTVTALVADNGVRYLVYVNRTALDGFRGFFGGMVRRIIDRRVRAEAPAVLHNLRKRLESGDPPA
jgi:hypothetical protein